jgi:DNA polymerase-1
MIESKKKLFLVDAYAIIFRAFYAFINSHMLNSNGINTAPIFGFVLALEDVLRNQKPSHIAVVFDPPGGTFRNEMYKLYKANRDETPEPIKIAVPWIKKIIQAFNIPVIEVPGFEADDVIGSIARQAQERDFLTYIMTPDKDFMQLVTDYILMFKPAKSGSLPEIIGINEVKIKFGIDQPSQFIDILALWGDSADNVPGAPGIGEKGALKLIGEYKSLENVYASLDKLKEKTRQILINNRQLIELSKRLVTIDQYAPIEFNESELKVKNSDIQLLTNIYRELDFKTLLSRLQKSPIVLSFTDETNNKMTEERNVQQKKQPIQPTLFDNTEIQVQNMDVTSLNSVDSVVHKYQLIKSDEEARELVKLLEKNSEICFNVYTNSPDIYSSNLVGISFSLKKSEACFVYLYDNNLIGLFKGLLENPSTIKISHNLKFSISVLKNYRINIDGSLFDTMIAHYLIQPEEQQNLAYLSAKFLKHKQITDKGIVGENVFNFKSFSETEINVLSNYASEAVDIINQLYVIFREDLNYKGLTSLFSNIEMPIIPILSDIELNGVRIDKNALDEYSKILTAELISLEEIIYNLAGESFNISSPKQLGNILFSKLKIGTATKKTKTKQNSTSEAVLNDLIDLHPIIRQILEYRSIKKLLSTYIDSLPKQISKKTGRLHTSFNQAAVATGRLSSTNPNLQNIPIRGERGREIRKAFVPADSNGFLVSADYSQIELRIMAHLSQDQNMINAFLNNEDIHTATASKIYGVSFDVVSKEMRNNAKTANFGIIYGISAFGLSQRLSISRQEADKLIQGYFSNFPEVRRFINNSILKARELGYVETLTGRRRYLPEILSANANIRGFAERNAINAPIQGSAADIIKIAMININNRLKAGKIESKMILQVHDELVFDVTASELEKLCEIVKYEMENAYKLIVPITVDIGYGKNWLEAH